MAAAPPDAASNQGDEPEAANQEAANPGAAEEVDGAEVDGGEDGANGANNAAQGGCERVMKVVNYHLQKCFLWVNSSVANKLVLIAFQKITGTP